MLYAACRTASSIQRCARSLRIGKEAPKWDQLLQQFLWQNHLSSHYQEVIKLINRDAGLSHAERIVHKLRGSQVALKCLYNLVRQDDKDEMMEPCDHADSAEFDRALLAIKEAFEKGDKQLALKINELWQAVKENADSCSKSQADHSKSDDSKTAGADVAAEEEAVASDEKLIAEKEGSNRPQRERVKKTRGS